MLTVIIGLWSFAKSPLGRWIALAVAVLALLAGVHHHGVTQGAAREKAKADRAINDPVTGWRARLGQCQANVKTLDDAVKTQNAAVAAWKAESAQRSEAAAKAVTEARKATVAANQRIGALMAAKSGADQCKSAEALIMEQVR